jgi:hypothetical protein
LQNKSLLSRLTDVMTLQEQFTVKNSDRAQYNESMTGVGTVEIAESGGGISFEQVVKQNYPSSKNS